MNLPPQQTQIRDAPLEQHPVIPAKDARQAVTGHNVRYVLGFGLAGIVVIFAGLWLYYFA